MRFFKNKLAVTVVLLSVSFLALIGVSVQRSKASSAENGVSSALNSVQGYIYKFNSSTKDFLGFITHFYDVKKENEDLKKQISDLQNMQQHYTYLSNDNTNLRKMLNFKDTRSDYQYKGCDIIGKSGSDWLDEFIINVGSNDGIVVGEVAINEEGCLIGKVTFVGTNWARVQTIANSNIAVSGYVGGNSDYNGIVKGYRGSNNKILAKLYYLPEDSNVKNGDVVATTGLDQDYPKDIRIGTVVGVEEDKGKLMKNVVVQPYVDFNKLQELFIVIPKNIRDVKY